jgi:threonine/homoserine/homoserine lactone efflux protein
MIESTTLLTYTAIVFGFVFIPGPATLIIMARSASSGSKAGVATGAGIAVGDLMHTLFAVVGISAIIAASSTLFSLIKYLGAAYLVYLGIKALLEKATTKTAQPTSFISAKKAFKQGLIVEVLNPKTALFFLAFLPQFVDPSSGSIALQLTTLGCVFILLGFISTLVFAFGANAIGRKLRKQKSSGNWQGKIVGSIYCALGVRLALHEH